MRTCNRQHAHIFGLNNKQRNTPRCLIGQQQQQGRDVDKWTTMNGCTTRVLTPRSSKIERGGGGGVHRVPPGDNIIFLEVVMALWFLFADRPLFPCGWGISGGWHASRQISRLYCSTWKSSRDASQNKENDRKSSRGFGGKTSHTRDACRKPLCDAVYEAQVCEESVLHPNFSPLRRRFTSDRDGMDGVVGCLTSGAFADVCSLSSKTPLPLKSQISALKTGCLSAFVFPNPRERDTLANQIYT